MHNMSKKITMKKVIITVVVLAGISAVLLAFVRPFEKKSSSLTLETKDVIRGDISEVITSTGTLEALETVEVGTQVSGIIDHIYVDYNSIVKKGQLLAKIDQTPLLAQLEQSQASVESAEAEADYQTANYERYKALAEQNLIAELDYKQVEYNYRKSLAALKNARSVHDKNKINLAYATITSPIDGIILDRAVDEGQTVAASFNTPTMFTIANDLTQMQVEANVDEADIGRLKVGQRVEFTVDAFPDMKFEGEVTQIRLQPVESSNVITYTVIVNAPNDELKLMPGMTANISFYVMELKDIVLMPAEAMHFMPDPENIKSYQELHPEITFNMPAGPEGNHGGEPRFVPGEGPGKSPGPGEVSGFGPEKGPSSGSMNLIWVKKGNSIEARPVELGETDELNYEVVSGLQAGDTVLTGFSSSDPNVAQNHTSQQSEARSPFMPQRPGGGGNPPRGAGGGG
jgi:HlyD family secretion protein